MKSLSSFRKFALGLLALALILTVTTVQADDPAPKKEKGPSKADLKKYDANGDGQLDETEIARRKADEKAVREAKRTEDLAKYDADKNDQLSKAEKENMKADKDAVKAEKKAQKEAKEAEKK